MHIEYGNYFWTHRGCRDGHDIPMNGARDIILIMEDDPWVADYIADVLNAFFSSFRILKTASVDEARKAFYAHYDEITAIVSDLSLGGADGSAIIREMAGGCHDIGIIFVTGHVENARELSKTVGRPVSLLLKPFGPVDLKTAIESRLAAPAENLISQSAG
jgi:DNA-binding NtrC family response regulator